MPIGIWLALTAIIKRLNNSRSAETKMILSSLTFTLRVFVSKGKDQESIQSSTTPDPGYQWESDNVTIRHHNREPRGQPFPSR